VENSHTEGEDAGLALAAASSQQQRKEQADMFNRVLEKNKERGEPTRQKE